MSHKVVMVLGTHHASIGGLIVLLLSKSMYKTKRRSVTRQDE